MNIDRLRQIAVVDDDVSSRESLPDLLRTFGLEATSFASAEDYLASDLLNKAHCLISDVSMPGMSGPDLLRELRRRQLKIPVIFITALNDKELRASLRAQGAVEGLFKPFSEDALRAALDRAVGAPASSPMWPAA